MSFKDWRADAVIVPAGSLLVLFIVVFVKKFKCKYDKLASGPDRVGPTVKEVDSELVKRLNDPDAEERRAAVDTPEKLEPAASESSNRNTPSMNLKSPRSLSQLEYSTEPVSIFYSYSHEDERLRDKLDKHLMGLQNQGIIRGWHDRRIEAGTEWDKVISKNLEEARIILLLVSPEFLASRYINDIEVARAMERHNAKTAQVIPVILRPTDWQSSRFGELKALPKDGKPVTMWQNRDKAFLDVVMGIRNVVAGKPLP